MDERSVNLARYRLEQAERCIKSAEILLAADDYKGAANRSYYAIFHSMRAILALDEKDFSKHTGVSAYFRKEYIKTGIFRVEMSDIVKSAFDIRSDSDYDDFFVIAKSDVEEQVENAKIFLKEINNYLEQRVRQ